MRSISGMCEPPNAANSCFVLHMFGRHLAYYIIRMLRSPFTRLGASGRRRGFRSSAHPAGPLELRYLMPSAAISFHPYREGGGGGGGGRGGGGGGVFFFLLVCLSF